MDSLIKLIAKDFIVISILGSLYIFWKLDARRRKHYALLVICAGILSLVLAKLGSHFITDIRPQFRDGSTPLFFHSNDNGFPSDHTLLASLLGFCALYYSKKYAAGLLIVAALIAWARVAAHVHHLEDVAGSFVITAIAYLVTEALLKRYLVRAKASHSDVK